MLIDYKFNNFCSFNTESEFSLLAPGGKVMKRYPDNYTSSDTDYDLLKTAVLVGENAGGKSNFINSLRFIKGLFVSNGLVKSLRPFLNSSSIAVEKQPQQSFALTFLIKDKIYSFQLVIDEIGIISEELQVWYKRKASHTIIYSITRNENGTYISDAGVAKSAITSVLKNSNNSVGLFINKIALLGIKEAQQATDWVQNYLCPEAVTEERIRDVKRQDGDLSILRDPRYLDIFRMIDYSICGLQANEENPYTKSIILRKDKNGNIFQREIQMDSTGVREFLIWAIEIFRVVYEERIVFADEMDRVLNPVLSDRVVSFITGSEHKGQFVFSTHNVLHLDLKTYMKEQIYFVTKDRDSLTSELYSLADFPEVRYETTKIYEFYMKGILGGVASE
ncbi:MAG: ATP/GTP-binding protein [Phascolarctobacterium sp.]